MSEDPEMEESTSDSRPAKRSRMDTSEGTPRLLIKKLVCENFKSYAGVKELGPFHKCFSSIVGPNGSGKSNVIDAMLFVFGYRAKKIRSKSVSVLIHNSEHHQNITSCCVTVHFLKIIDLPGDDYQAVPRSEFTVSRTAFKDNSSYYQLNGKKVPFKEVAVLLRKSGIDLDHNRFLILQGEVEQIALMKPKAQSEHDEGMLEFLEDIVGSSRYKEPIVELEKRVDELNEARGEKVNRVKVVEKEKDDLEGAKNEAEEFLATKKNKAQEEYTLYQRRIHDCSQLEAKAKEKKDEVEGTLAGIQSTLAEHTTAKEDKKKIQKKLQSQHDKHSGTLDKLRAALASCEQRDVKARQDLKNAKTGLKKTMKALEKEKEKMEELTAAPERLQKEIANAEKKLKILEKRKVEEEEKLSEVMASLQADTLDLQKDKEELEGQLVGLSQTVNKTKSTLDMAQAELDLYRDRHTAGERQLSEAREQLSTAQQSLQDKQRELTSLNQSLPKKRQALTRAQDSLHSVQDKAARLHQQVNACRAHVEETRSALHANKSRGRVLDALMQQKSSGAIPGICGRLGDLGTIPDKYDVAISTACSALDNIVCDTMDTAVQCVEFLKTNNIGQATFIGLDKVETWRRHATSKIATPEDVPRLFDLVQSKDERYLTAFYYALKNTLVANNLDQATRIGLQGRTRHRVVSLQGHLIDQSGTMTGGGRQVSRGRMSSKPVLEVSPVELKQQEAELERQERELGECSTKRMSLESQVKTLTSEISNEEKQIKKLSRDVQVLDEQIKGLHERIETLEVQSQESTMDPAELAKLEKQVKLHQKGYDKAAATAGEVKEQVQGLHDQIMEIGGSRVQQQQKQLDSVKKEMSNTSAAITKANVAIKTAQRNSKKSESKISSLETEITAAQQSIEQLKQSLTELEEEAKVVIEQQEEHQTAMLQVEKELSGLKAELDAIEQEEKGISEQVMDLKHELEQHQAKMKENQQKIRHYNQEIGKLQLGEEDKEELSADQLMAVDKKAVESRITMLEEQLSQMTPNMAAIEEYRKKSELYQTRLQELEAITGDRDSARREFDALRKRRLDEFMEGFSIITSKLKEMYQMITLGGDAELELVDTLDPFSEGIVFSVRPPKKSWKNISNLSGGEKTLSSLALVFALHHYKPSPLYVMDEIDAALDFKNVSIVANYIKERTKNAQFIIISLRNNMFELADRLVGIYKTDNCTKSVTIDPFKIGHASSSSLPVIAEA